MTDPDPDPVPSSPRERLLGILRTDPADVGCGHFHELLDVYVELVVAGLDPEEQLPGAAAHLRACGPCAEDYRGLLQAVDPGREA